jgi:hypothetical protein
MAAVLLVGGWSVTAIAAVPVLSEGVAEAAECTPTAATPTGASVGISPTEDACGNTAAVSGIGNAETSGCEGVVLDCVAVSGTGDATNNASVPDRDGGCTTPAGFGCVAVSGTGDATNDAHGGPDWGEGGCQVDPLWVGVAGGLYEPVDAAGIGCLAVSGTGTARNNADSYQGSGCNVYGGVVEVGCAALSGTGDATNDASSPFFGGCGSFGGGVLVGCLAASGAGDATNNSGPDFGCRAVTGPNAPRNGLVLGCVAASVLGSAANNAPGEHLVCEGSGVVAIGCTAVSPEP